LILIYKTEYADCYGIGSSGSFIACLRALVCVVALIEVVFSLTVEGLPYCMFVYFCLLH